MRVLGDMGGLLSRRCETAGDAVWREELTFSAGIAISTMSSDYAAS